MAASILKRAGSAMQDDIADGTRWAIAQGYADPKLYGLIKDPDLYKCGINWVGVTHQSDV
ncbi:hypothetical protein EJG51_010610 [Undibacterium piscinae]|uniref:Uncharacterized protein n=1 Tax=Undibacterium piscinae TaxID=2495591 RepID=A0A6M4A535_9BURK|nr:hypothetical protein EJG51_010610 [Undibacterium piscinae]